MLTPPDIAFPFHPWTKSQILDFALSQTDLAAEYIEGPSLLVWAARIETFGKLLRENVTQQYRHHASNGSVDGADMKVKDREALENSPEALSEAASIDVQIAMLEQEIIQSDVYQRNQPLIAGYQTQRAEILANDPKKTIKPLPFTITITIPK